jgi:steroid delta-isomerase-like uncharacterized protein
MAIAERQELQSAYLEAWLSHDPAAVTGFFTADAVYDDHGIGETASGQSEIRSHVERVMTAFPDLRFELTRTSHGDDFSCGEWRATMTHLGELSGLAPTGRRLRCEGVDVARLRGGRIAHLVSYYDGARLMRDLGLLPARGSRMERVLLSAASLLRRRP